MSKQLIQDFHQFKQSRGNESSCRNSSFNCQKNLQFGLSTHDNKSSTVALETELNLNEQEEKNHDQDNNKQKRKSNEESLKHPACDYSANEMLEATDSIVTANQNLKDDSETTKEDEHKEIELKNEETYVNKAIKVETEANPKIICATSKPHFEMLNNASEEDTFRPHFQDIKIEILETTIPIVAVDFKQDSREDEFKKSVLSCDRKAAETDQNLHQHEENIHKCTLCAKQYTTKHSLKYHMISHTGKQPFKCKECNYATKTHKELRLHYWSKHNKPMEMEELNQSSICSICRRYCGTSSRLKTHMLSHEKSHEKPYKCNICNMRLSYRETLNRHILRHTGIKRFACHICQNTYTTKTSLQFHMKSHTGEKPYRCKECHYATYSQKLLRYHCWSRHNKPTEMEGEPNQNSICSICGKYCGTPNRLKKHMPVHTKPYKCKICNVNFSYRQSLTRHVLCHSGLKRFACHICHNRYTAKASLDCHIKIHTGEKPYPCKECAFAGKTRSELHKHCKSKHLIQIQAEPKQAPVCPICNKEILNLRRHMLTHKDEKPFECKICHLRYKSRSSLEFHMKSHTGEKPFHCTHCDYSAKTDKQVRYHCNRMHVDKMAGSNKYNVTTKKTCPICNKKIRELNRHLLTHTGEKPFECNICQKRFTSKNSLEFHLKSHTGEKPFRCMQCDYSAKTNKQVREHYNRMHVIRVANLDSNIVNTKKAVCPICNKRILQLKRHMLTHTGEKPFECNICHNRYTTKNSLEYHTKSHTGEKPFRCTECNYSARTDKQIRCHYNCKHTDKKKPISHKNKNISRTGVLKRFECDVCQKRFRNKASLIHHRKTHIGEKLFKCTECDYLASDNNTLQNHYKNNHTFFVIEGVNVEQPRSDNQNKMCERINSTAGANRNLKGNAENIENNEHNTSKEEAFEPSEALEATSRFETVSDAFKEDMDKAHLRNPKSNLFEAVGPTIAVNYKWNLEESEDIQNKSTHKEVKAKDKTTHVNPYTEVHKTDEARDLDENPENIQAIKPEEVQIKDELTFEDNLVFTAVRENDGDLGKHSRISTADQSYACNACKFDTADKDNFQQHLLSHNGEKLFACDVCEFKTAYKSNLRTHMYIHADDKPFTCSSCNFKTACTRNLKKHMRIHSEEKPFVCSVCEFKTVHKRSLEQHLRIHTGEALFACTYCEYKSITKGRLDNHMSIHTGKKPFACHLCNFKTTCRGNLNNHMPVHTEEKPFACDLCDFRSKRKYTLTKHMLVHFEDKQFACDLCEFKTSHKCSLKRHVASHRGEKKVPGTRRGSYKKESVCL